MRKLTVFISALFVCFFIGQNPLSSQCTDLYIEGFIDGPLPSGTPKAIQLCATANIPDLSDFGIEVVANANASNGSPSLTLPAESLSAGDCYWITNDETNFLAFFGFGACLESGTISNNGNDDYLLYCNGLLTDVHGVDAQDETGQPWEFLDGWANRTVTTPNATFTSSEWTYSGINVLDGETTNATSAVPYPNTNAGCPALPEVILISEVELCTQTIELQNTGGSTVDITNWRLCSRPIYNAINSASVSVLSGSLMLAPGDFVVLQWTNMVNAAGTAGEIGLYLPTGGFSDPLSIADYVVYNGIPSSNRAATAVSAGVWDDDTMSATFETAAGCASGIANETDPSSTNSTTWCTADMNTLVSPYTNSACLSNLMCPSPGDLVITEIMPNPDAVSDSNGEFFEVYNTTSMPIEMQGFIIKDDGSDSHQIASSVIVPAGGYSVFVNNLDQATNGGIVGDYQYSGFLATTDELVLECAGTEIDRVNWTSSWPLGVGASMVFDPALLDGSNDATENNLMANWCQSTTTYGAGDLGTPGAANDICTAPTCMLDLNFVDNIQCINGDFIFDVNFTAIATSGTIEVYDVTNSMLLGTGTDVSPITVTITANSSTTPFDIIVRDASDNSCASMTLSVTPIDCSAISCAAVGDLVITEILFDPNPPEDGNDEFFEVHNPTGADIDMFGYTIRDNGSDDFTITTSFIVPAGAYVVFGENGDMATNGGVAVDYIYPQFTSIANTEDEIIIECNGTVIDEVAYDRSNGWPGMGDGVTISLDPGSLDATSNDDPANWCEATSTTGVFTATLGSANDSCSSLCPNDLILSGNLDVTTDYEAANTITSTEVIGMTTPGISVDYDAGMMINLDPTFEVKLGVMFHAFIDGCGGL